MRRAANLWPSVVDFDRLVIAARRAARGKSDQPSVARFLLDVEPEVLRLSRELEEGTWRPGATKSFVIHDPKERTITVPPFRDRVVHHAVIGALEPHLERRMVHESFACRKGKGVSAALDHAQHQLRRFGGFLKMDIAQCFPSIAHEVALSSLARVVKDRRVLDLLKHIIEAGSGGHRGLPIGSLTSQWTANTVLDRLDHFVKEQLRIPGYVRYLDDFVLFADEREQLRASRDAVTAYLADTLDLIPKERATMLRPSRCGLPFLGWMLYPGLRRIRRANADRCLNRIRQRLLEHRRGVLDEDRLADSVRSSLAFLKHGQTHRLREAWMTKLAPYFPP